MKMYARVNIISSSIQSVKKDAIAQTINKLEMLKFNLIKNIRVGKNLSTLDSGCTLTVCG